LRGVCSCDEACRPPKCRTHQPMAPVILRLPFAPSFFSWLHCLFTLEHFVVAQVSKLHYSYFASLMLQWFSVTVGGLSTLNRVQNSAVGRHCKTVTSYFNGNKQYTHNPWAAKHAVDRPHNETAAAITDTALLTERKAPQVCQ
jgi:hypothetical protein